MNVFVLYLLLLKATLTSFSGLSSLPMLRNDLVVSRRVITDRQLNVALGASRMGSGPLGLYVVSVGYFAAGVPGAVAGWLAMVTPAFLIIPMLRYVGRRAERPAVKRAIEAVTLAAAGLMISISVPLGRDALVNPWAVAIASASFLVLAFTRVDTLWVVVGSALAGLLKSLI